jgi:hypothetical protein
MAVALATAARSVGAFAAPQSDGGSELRLVSEDVPLGQARRGLSAGDRTLPARSAPRFTMLGLHWQGGGEVRFRTHSLAGWSPWVQAVVHELPEADEGLAGWQLGTPYWTRPADAVQYRLVGQVERLRAHFVWSTSGSSRRLAAASAPSIVLRPGWGADESIVRGEPRYADQLAVAILHHTAGASPQDAGESVAVVRAIQRYHVESNGWNDIGYNFLVDPFGQVFEGRAGGIDRDVVGAHALGFNTGSAGIALLGNFENRVLTAAERSALAGLLAWRLDAAHVDPLSTSSLSGRSLRAVSGHRDVNSTACPGANLYPELGGVAAEASALGLPKLYEPSATVGAGTVTFHGRLSEPRPHTITVRDPTGATVASFSGTGAAILWTWNSAGAAAGGFNWSIDAGPDVRPASGSFMLGPAPPPISGGTPPSPTRPEGIPRNIPGWARSLRAWHLSPRSQRGARPRSPRPLPSWYWPWYRWRNQMDRWEAQFGHPPAG